LDEKDQELLHLIEENARASVETLAKMVDLSVEETALIIKDLEERKIILGYSTVIDWTKVTSTESVTAMIDVKVTPKRGVGFDDVAQRIYRFSEVRALYLMSGAYDLQVVIEGKTMNEVARFVSDKLSTIDSVISTTTHFQLKKYKHDGVIFSDNEGDNRIVITP
jgi:DNA-binding Lrp family transcriptional regulator